MGGSGGGSYHGEFSGSGSGGGFSGGGSGVGGGGADGGGSGGGGLLKCANIRFIAVLNSPQPSVIATLIVGETLDISIHSGTSVSVVVTKNGSIAGSITGQYISDLLSCIQNGYSYVAEVISLNGGQCNVEVFCQ